MKKLAMLLICLMMALIYSSIPVNPVISASDEDIRPFHGFPNIPQVPNYNESIIDLENMTDQYPDAYSAAIALLEVDLAEGGIPVYLLVFQDEEEREISRQDWYGNWWNWTEWAIIQIERADETLISTYGIDLRILGFLDWDSDDSLHSITDLWFELAAEKDGYLRNYYNGEYWSGYVDLVIGITAQPSEEVGGAGPSALGIDRGLLYVVLRFCNFWADDNVVLHEISHTFYLDDYTCPPHCVMASLTDHYQQFIHDDGAWDLFNYAPCTMTTSEWCSSCAAVINTYRFLYVDEPYKLTVRYSNPAEPRGTLSLAPGIHAYDSPTTIFVSVVSANPGYHFSCWLVDGEVIQTGTTISIYVNTKRSISASFVADGGVGGFVISRNKPTLLTTNIAIGILSILTIAGMGIYLKLKKKH